jgi:flavin-dependent dehydrogenase
MTRQRASLPDQCDVVVIGAGPAGSSAAALLHRAGHNTLILERETFPRFVIGESLLPRCMDLLDEAGLLSVVQARGYLKKRGALFLNGDRRSSFDFGDQFTKGWDHAFQVPRADFDATLADAVEGMGVPIFYRHTVSACDFSHAPNVEVRDEAGQSHRISCRFVIDASGYGRVLPRLLGLEEPSNQALRQAIFTHVRGDRRPAGAEEGRIWVCMHPEGAWIWIIPFSNNITSVGVVGTPEFFAKYPGDPGQQLRAIVAGDPNAAPRLAAVEFEFDVATLRGYSVAVKQVFGRGYCLVGNATEFLDPVFSSGVTLALESANRGAKTLIRELAGEDVDWQVDYADYMMRGIDTFRTYVNGWYDGSVPRVFFSENTNPDVRRQICSVLSGYVWDLDNPCVRQHARRLAQLDRILRENALSPSDIGR